MHRGPLVALGYWNDPERTAGRFRPAPARPDGICIPEMAVWSGDTVRMDEEGYLYFVGRRDEMIKSSGYRVSPGEIEEVLYDSGLVGEAVAVGVPHPLLGQVIAVVATAPKGRGLDAEALLRTCRRQLPSYMVPQQIIERDTLPRNPNGKIDRTALRLELEASGKSVHSAYPELGDSAIDKLLDNLQALRQVEWPVDELLGDTTLNIGTISGGRAANVIPDHAAASVAIRVVSSLEDLKKLVFSTLDERVTARISSEVPAVRLESAPGFETTIVKYATDIPKLTNWGQPLLIGPGTIHVAHGVDEHVPKKQLIEAVELYKSLVKQLQATH